MIRADMKTIKQVHDTWNKQKLTEYLQRPFYQIFHDIENLMVDSPEQEHEDKILKDQYALDLHEFNKIAPYLSDRDIIVHLDVDSVVPHNFTGKFHAFEPTTNTFSISAFADENYVYYSGEIFGKISIDPIIGVIPCTLWITIAVDTPVKKEEGKHVYTVGTVGIKAAPSKTATKRAKAKVAELNLMLQTLLEESPDMTDIPDAASMLITQAQTSVLGVVNMYLAMRTYADEQKLLKVEKRGVPKKIKVAGSKKKMDPVKSKPWLREDLPVYIYLDDLPKPDSGTTGTGKGGTHRSPRPHERTPHTRVLKHPKYGRNVGKVIQVKGCTVGDYDPVIHNNKIYTVREIAGQ